MEKDGSNDDNNNNKEANEIAEILRVSEIAQKQLAKMQKGAKRCFSVVTQAYALPSILEVIHDYPSLTDKIQMRTYIDGDDEIVVVWKKL